jgi:propionyl-CoA carboxylase beta chain
VAAITILDGKKLKTIEDPILKMETTKQLQKSYETEFLNPFVAAEYGYIDAVIEPNETRKHLIKAITLLQKKVEKLPTKRQANQPL